MKNWGKCLQDICFIFLINKGLLIINKKDEKELKIDYGHK